ncbi:unnamed protein product [Phytophthora fragariaefolia]|uniref:Unnamed protein product n=1 Tax=Phytophthora fragariaefolia TaxID=1490495 RepID=A0A9W6XRK4_9STRA|nr:unnamed protein product [Phytophthora fragariaefolia]
MDCGSQANVCGVRECFIDLKPVQGKELMVMNGSTTNANQKGTVVLCIQNEFTGKLVKRKLEEVWYVPHARANLISLHFLQTEKYRMTLQGEEQQLAYLTKEDLRIMFNKIAGLCAVQGLKINKDLETYECVPCEVAKVKAFGPKTWRAIKQLERLCVDVDSIEDRMACGSKMFMLVVDEYSRYKWAYLLRSKDEAAGHLTAFDQGTEFVNKEVEKVCEMQDTEVRTTNGYRAQENGLVERGNGMVVTKVRVVLEETQIPFELWGEALLHVIDTINVTPSRVIEGKIPHEMIYEEKPDVFYLRTWGSAVDGYKWMSAIDGKVGTAQGGNITFREGYTIATHYVKQMIENAYMDGEHTLPSVIPYVRMRADMDSLVVDQENSQTRIAARGRDEELDPVTFEDYSNGSSPKSQEKSKATPSTKRLAAETEDDDARSVLIPEERLLADEVPIPRSFKEAIKDPRFAQYWMAAMDEEMNSLMHHGVWVIVARDKEKGKKTVMTNRWVYAVKKDEHGFVRRFKARLADLSRSMGSITSRSTLRLFDLRLSELPFTLLSSGTGMGFILMLLTVYDLLLMGPLAECEAVRRLLQETFELVELGPFKYFLGVEVLINQVEKTVFFSQETYINEVLKRFGMQYCHGAPTPEATSLQAPRKDASKEVPYREAVGALQYLVSGSRPDIAHAVRRLGQYMSCYTTEHFGQVKRVLRYLKTTSNYGLLMVVYAERGGTSSPCINALSTMDAGYYAMNEGTKDVQWLKKLCKELNIKYEQPRLLYDNKTAIFLSEKPGKHHHVKHIENKYHYVRNLAQNQELRTEHVGTDEQVVDVMTNALTSVKFVKFSSYA